MFNYKFQNCPEPKLKPLEKFFANYKKEGGAFFDLPENFSTAELCWEYALGTGKNYRDIVVLGVGGSSLGVKALLAVFPPRTHRFHFLENLDSESVTNTLSQVDLPHALFIVITKSGTTLETLTHFFLVLARIEKAGLRPGEHFVFVTDEQKNLLHDYARKFSAPLFTMPTAVGGRYSVLTAVGLLPLALAGYDPRELLAGAKKFRTDLLQKRERHALSRVIATEFVLQKKFPNRVSCFYRDNLSAWSAWFSQLCAESLGKEEKGITPLSLHGSCDQHSLQQLYLEGKKDKYFLALRVTDTDKELVIPKISDANFAYLSGKKMSEISAAQETATYQNFSKHKFPLITITVPALTLESFGAWLFLCEVEVAVLGQLLKINPYDQPAVEAGKILTKKLLTCSLSSKRKK